MKLTYSDFEIGQILTCTGTVEEHGEFHIDPGYKLTTGNQYEITDLDFHFPNSVCVNLDSGNGAFMNIELFDNMKHIRNIKLKELGI